MNEFERLLQVRLEADFKRRLDAHSCDCGMLMIDASDGSDRIWCPLCGKFKDAPVT